MSCHSAYWVDVYAPTIDDPERTRAELAVLQQVAAKVHQVMGGCEPVVSQQGQLVCPLHDLVNGITSYAFMPSSRVRLEVHPDPVPGQVDVPDGTPVTAYL